MTPQQLLSVLETNKFRLQPPFEPIEYEFKKGCIYKGGEPYSYYEIYEGTNGHFQMKYTNQVKINPDNGQTTYTLIFGFDNILIVVDNDPRFPVIVNFDPNRLNGSFTVLKAIQKLS